MITNFSLFEQLYTPVWVYDIENKKILWANSASLPLWEAASLTELTSRDFSLDMSAAVSAMLNAYLERFRDGEVIKTWWSLNPRKVKKQVLCTFSGIRLPDGRLNMLVEVNAEESSLRRELAFSNCTNLALLFSSSGQLISANDAFVYTFGDHVNDLSNFIGDNQTAQQWLSTAKTDKSIKCEQRCWTGLGYNWFDVQGYWIYDKQQLLLQLTNISENKEKLKREQYNAEHDYLTGLLNRRGITRSIQETNKSSQPYTLLFLDIDGFKLVNDTFGHSVGDKLLYAISQRLKELVTPKGRLARFGGDEFVVQIEHDDHSDVSRLSKTIIAALNKPFYLNESGEISIGCSIGTAAYPVDSQQLEILISQADMAMHRAKQHGRNHHQSFSPEMASEQYRKMKLRHRLSMAIKANNFTLLYQPIMDLKTFQLKGFEALIRWYDEELGLVSPMEFIPLAEETGQIAAIGSWVLNNAFQQLARWNELSDLPLIMSINLSRCQLKLKLCCTIANLLEEHGIAPTQVALEITESAVIHNYNEGKQCLENLKKLDLELYLDDFGTGFSSLSQLQDLPITTVKLDKSFVQAGTRGSNAIIAATQAICDKLQLKLVAEGVETMEQLEYLQARGFDFAQGYLLNKPISAQEIEAMQFKVLNVNCLRANSDI